MKRYILPGAAVLAVVLLGCKLTTEHRIDAHITVDIRHIQEQASDIVDFIEGDSDELSVDAPSNTSMLRTLWNAVAPVQVAHAAELNSKSPEVERIAKELRALQSEIDQLMAKGYIGLDNRGYLALRPHPDLDDAEAKNETQRFIAKVNDLRNALYREVARLNRDSGASLTTVERVFAGEFRDRAKSGHWVELPEAGAPYDTFLDSDLAKKLGDKAKPGAWVQVP